MTSSPKERLLLTLEPRVSSTTQPEHIEAILKRLLPNCDMQAVLASVEPQDDSGGLGIEVTDDSR
jgi:hypothetical protein